MEAVDSKKRGRCDLSEGGIVKQEVPHSKKSQPKKKNARSRKKGRVSTVEREGKGKGVFQPKVRPAPKKERGNYKKRKNGKSRIENGSFSGRVTPGR